MIGRIRIVYRKNGKIENSNDMAEKVGVSKFLELKADSLRPSISKSSERLSASGPVKLPSH